MVDLVCLVADLGGLLMDLGCLVVDMGCSKDYTAGKLYFKSQAVAKALSSLGGPLIVATYAIYFTPAFLANGVYDFVARNRKRWFSPTCTLPSAETKNQFLL